VQFQLTDTQEDIQKGARKFAEKEFLSDLALKLDKEGAFPQAIFEKACRLNFVGIGYPEKFGGLGLGLFEEVLVIEEFCKRDSGIGIAISLADLASGIILRHGREQQKERFVAPVNQGKTISTVAAMDAFEKGNPIPAKAEKDGSGYVLSGRKSFVLNGSIANTFVVFCDVHPSPDPKSVKSVTLIVKRDQEGVAVSDRKRMMGLRMTPINDVSFDRVKVPEECVIDGEGDHLSAFMTEQRIKVAAQGVGIAQRALTQAVAHGNEREQFGRKVGQFQGLQFMYAELFTQIEAARSLVYRAALGDGAKSSDVEKIASVARIFATDVAVKTTIDAIQLHGGIGLMREYPIERMFRDVKTIQNLGETNLSLRAMIGKSIVGG
jgi:alkylation response protein AidB-like acyl-CoA dehydrogenase